MPLRRQTRTEDCLILDVGALLRAAQRQPTGILETVTGSLAYALGASHHEIRVAYRIDGEIQALAVDLVTDEPNFGGTRTWFSCPDCDRRCRKLYVPPACPRLACRYCHSLAYTSQLLNPMCRARKRAADLRVRLGGAGVLAEPFPPRPRGMWRRTYWRRWAKAVAAESEFWRLLAQRLA